MLVLRCRGICSDRCCRKRNSSVATGNDDHASRKPFTAAESAAATIDAIVASGQSRGTPEGSRHAASSSTTSGCSPPVADAPLPCRRSSVRPVGVSQRAVVNRSDNSGERRTTRCTTPLPYVAAPTSNARSCSRSAAAITSAELAVPASTSTVRGMLGQREPCARYTCGLEPPRPANDATTTLVGRNSAATFTPSSNNPPPLPRKSNTSDRAPRRVSNVTAPSSSAVACCVIDASRT